MKDVTFSSSEKTVTVALDENKLKMARVMADKIFNNVAVKFGESEYPEMYFYVVLALYEQARDTIAFIGPENMRLGLEV